MIARALQCPIFVGRRAERDALGDARRALAQSRGSVVLIGGEAGIGKTRLVRHFLASFERDTRPRRLARAQCVEGFDLPFGPFRDLIGGLRAAEIPREPGAARAVEQLAPGARALAGTAPLATNELFSGLAAYFTGIAEKRSTILAIEDIHWADRSSLEFLCYLAARVARTRLLVIATYRSEEVETREPLLVALSRLEREPAVARIAVEPLGAADMNELIASTLRDTPLAPNLRAAVIERAEGNPFYAEELLRDALETRAPESGGSLPLSIRGAIRERLGRLSDEDRRIVTHAAVLGDRFEPDVLALALETDVDAILPTLRRGRDLNIFAEEDTVPVRFRFRHALTRQAVYVDLLRFDARRMHERLLETLESIGRPDRYVEALAYHAIAAHDAPKALRYNEAAGDAALAMMALPEAAAFYERALERAATDVDRARLHAGAARALNMRGETVAAIPHYERALALYERLDDMPGAVEAILGIINGMNNLRDFSCVARGSAFVARHVDRVPAGTLDDMLATLARLATIQYEYAEAQRLIERIHDPGALDTLGRFNYLLARLHVRWGEGDVAGWRETAAAVLAEVDRPSTSPYSAVTMGYIVAQDASALGCSDVADAGLARAEATGALAEFTTLRGFGEAVRALHEFMRGDLAASRASLERSLALPGIPVVRMARWFVAPLLAAALGEARYVDAEDERGVDALRSSARMGWDAKALGHHAVWKLANGETAAARDLLRAALPCMRRPYPGTGIVLALAAQHLEGADLIELERILGARLHPADTGGRANVALARAVLAARGASPGDASELALAAAAGYRDLGWAMLEARALECAGRVADARAIYVRCGASSDAARLRGAAPAYGAEGATCADAVETPLTNREAAIADLIARGETNATIAERLDISVKTVEKHVSSAFAKLGVRNRAQLAARLGPQTTAV